MQLKKSNKKEIEQILDADYAELCRGFQEQLGPDNPFADRIETDDSVIWCAEDGWNSMVAAHEDDFVEILDALVAVKVSATNVLGDEMAEHLFTYPDDDYVFYRKGVDGIQIKIAGWGYRRNPNAIIPESIDAGPASIPTAEPVPQFVNNIPAAPLPEQRVDSDPSQIRFCPQCGASLRPGMLFCPLCGKSISASPVITPVANNPVVPEPVVTPTYPPKPSSDTKVLAWCAGILGVVVVFVGIVLFVVELGVFKRAPKQTSALLTDTIASYTQEDLEMHDVNYMMNPGISDGRELWVRDSIKSDKYDCLFNYIETGDLDRMEQSEYNNLPDAEKNSYWKNIVVVMRTLSVDEARQILSNSVYGNVFYIQQASERMLKRISEMEAESSVYDYGGDYDHDYGYDYPDTTQAW